MFELQPELADPRLLEHAKAIGAKLRGWGTRQALMCGFAMIFNHAPKSGRTEFESRFEEFCEKLLTGSNEKLRSPTLALRDGLMASTIGAKETGRRRAIIMAASVVKAWNLFVDNRRGGSRTLAWDIEDVFPTPVYGE